MGMSFRIKSSVLPEHANVVAFRGSEGLARPYVFDVYIEVTGPLDIEVDDAPGAKAMLSFERDGRYLTSYGGVIAQFELLRAHVTGGTSRALYLLRLVPQLWSLSLTRHSRVYTKLTVPELIELVLSDEGVHDVELRLNGTYADEEHITQYKESSLDFIQRWMEREGLYYFFEQTDEGEKLVVTDHNAASTSLAAEAIRYHPTGEGDESSGIHFDTFIARNRSLPAMVKFADYDYGKPQLDVRGSSKVSPNGVGDQVTYGKRFFTPDQGNALAAIRADDLRAQAKNFYAAGLAPQMMAGYTFWVDQHPKADLNAEYLAVTVEHHLCLEEAKAWGAVVPYAPQPYRCEVTAIVASQQYRHPETVPWPRIDGFENANVDGPASSEYAQVDDQGRYSLKFKFDEGSRKDGKASTWVRKMQPHAGSVEGWHFPERKGTEVVCAFLGGDPDRPVIVGAIPTAVHPSPVTSGNHTKNVIQTGGRNRFEMEDQDGAQRVTISTPHAKSFFHIGAALEGMSTVFSGEGTIPDHQVAIHTEGNSLINTCGTYDIETGEDWNVVIGNDHHEQIGCNRVDEVGGFMKQAIQGLLLQDVTGSVEEAYHSTFKQGVQGDVTEDYKSHHSRTVGGSQLLKVEGTQEVEVVGAVDWKTGNADWHVKGELKIKADGPHEIESATWHEKTWGKKSEFIGGWKNEIVIGGSTEFFAGLKAEICVAGAVEIFVGGKLEITAAWVHKIEPEEAETIAMKNSITALRTDVDGIKNYNAAMLQGATALTSKIETLENSVGTLKSSVAALHSQA